MAKTKNDPSAELPGFTLRFNLASLVIFSVALIMAGGGLVFILMQALSKENAAGLHTVAMPDRQENKITPAVIPPWGELATYDMEIEQPDEYAANDFTTNHPAAWIFDGLSPESVRGLLLQSGFTTSQVERALVPAGVTVTPAATILTPDSDLVFSLAPEVRGKLYGELARSPANFYMYFPACFAGNTFQLAMEESEVDAATLALIKPLLYKRGSVTFFSDFEVVMARVPTDAQKLALMKALTRQPGVLARVRIRPTTDVEKMLGYWTQTPGVRLKDLRPLLESIKRLDDGATVSVLYFLPPFARERLFTFPMPSKVGDPAMDCHWSSLNFFRDKPDNRLGDPTYVKERLENDYYLVQRPSKYGDIIVLADDQGNGIHSAVYIADDIVFTKNGNNYVQPWMLMRLNNLVAKYSIRGTPRLLVYRNNNS